MTSDGAGVRATLVVADPGGDAETARISCGAGRIATVSITGPFIAPVTVRLPGPWVPWDVTMEA